MQMHADRDRPRRESGDEPVRACVSGPPRNRRARARSSSIAITSAAWSELGATVIALPAEPDLPDSVFVEDPAVVVDEVAVIARLGAESRRAEAESLAHALAPFRPVQWMKEPATLEGGDVIRIGSTLYVGVSQRTNVDGIAQLADLLAPYGYEVRPVEVRGCLHLKSGACCLGRDTLLVNRDWIDAGAFKDYTVDRRRRTLGRGCPGARRSHPHARRLSRNAKTLGTGRLRRTQRRCLRAPEGGSRRDVHEYYSGHVTAHRRLCATFVFTGADFLLDSARAERAFLGDVLGFPAVDGGGDWLIFALPPAELAVHPGDRSFTQTHVEPTMLGAILYLMCDDLPALISS